MERHPSRVLVAMSGGVDSSLSAALLKEEGWAVYGLHFVLPAEEKAAQERLVRVSEVARHLNIPLVSLDLRDVFSQRVIEPFVDAYCRGLTPNPCVICNEAIKFRYLREHAGHQGINFVATGHYARIQYGPSGGAQLWRGLAGGKEQSYFLHRLPQAALSRTVFPLASFTKEEAKKRVRTMALPVRSAPESQEICFLPDPDYRRLVEERGRPMTEPMGKIVDSDGRVLGTHQGTHRYTIGQRHGLGIASSRPYYVKRINPRENTVVVGRREELYSRRLGAESFHWIGTPLSGRIAGVRAQIRYRHRAALGTLEVVSPDAVHFLFDEPQWAITPGQALVCYEGDRVIGGGWIRTEKGVS